MQKAMKLIGASVLINAAHGVDLDTTINREVSSAEIPAWWKSDLEEPYRTHTYRMIQSAFYLDGREAVEGKIKS